MATTDSAPGARNTDYAQALALAGLLAGASLSLSRLYAGNAWLLPTWLTMGAALGLAALLRRLGVGQLLSLLAMVVGFVVVGGILLFPGTLLVVVPTGRTLTEMAAADAQAAGIATLLDRAGWRTAMLSRTQPLDDPWRRLTAPLGRATLTTRRR